MPLQSDIEDIRSKLKAGGYQNEAGISQGIILRLLHTLGWPIFDSSHVTPEYKLGTGRVDFALCHPPRKPTILIESKDVGSAYGSEKQLVEYAFHQTEVNNGRLRQHYPRLGRSLSMNRMRFLSN